MSQMSGHAWDAVYSTVQSVQCGPKARMPVPLRIVSRFPRSRTRRLRRCCYDDSHAGEAIIDGLPPLTDEQTDSVESYDDPDHDQPDAYPGWWRLRVQGPAGDTPQTGVSQFPRYQFERVAREGTREAYGLTAHCHHSQSARSLAEGRLSGRRLTEREIEQNRQHQQRK